MGCDELREENALLKVKIADLAGEVRVLSDALDEAHNGNKIQDDIMLKINAQGYDL